MGMVLDLSASRHEVSRDGDAEGVDFDFDMNLNLNATFDVDTSEHPETASPSMESDDRSDQRSPSCRRRHLGAPRNDVPIDGKR
jgi:hypothetical protein